MKIVGADGQEQEETDIPFRLWRKFAARRKLQYQSWEEGKEVLLNKLDRNLLTDFKAFAARFSSRPRPSKIFGTSLSEAISGEGNGQSGRGAARNHPRARTRCGATSPNHGGRVVPVPVAAASPGAPKKADEAAYRVRGRGRLITRRAGAAHTQPAAIDLGGGFGHCAQEEKEAPFSQARAPAITRGNRGQRGRKRRCGATNGGFQQPTGANQAWQRR
ncbi:UXP [unidentified adenovirus]|uniref:U exon protein n=6 Tax=Human mastadenovirus C TaxID=129951 RepID=UXP_ADE05|nr:RecName: Full=U exon protein; Short=UXP [Human adenovirus 5]ABW72885.1 U exon protein [Human adenovirus 5]UVG42294.1 UXP [unidentified adenovirus]